MTDYSCNNCASAFCNYLQCYYKITDYNRNWITMLY